MIHVYCPCAHDYINYEFVITWTRIILIMIYSSIISFLLILVTTTHGQIVFPKFSTAAQLKHFIDGGGEDLIRKFPQKVFECGKTAGEKYSECIEGLVMHQDFKEIVKGFVPSDFDDKDVFDEKYNRAIIKFSGAENKTSLLFSFNFLAIFLLCLSAGIVYAVNFFGGRKSSKKAELEKKSVPLITKADLGIDDDNDNCVDNNGENAAEIIV